MRKTLKRFYRARHERYLELLRWREHLGELVAAVEEVLPEADVYVFGSLIRSEPTAGSDIDVLIVSDDFPALNRHEIAVEIEERLSYPLLFEMHLIPPQKLPWYSRHAEELTPASQLVSGGELDERDRL